MSEPIFSEMDLRLSVVPRWVVVPTLQNQTVAEHCFNVERIARRIAIQWFNLSDSFDLDRVSQFALHHDDEEAVIGDIPSPAKSILSEAYLDRRRAAWYNGPGLLTEIVKLADLMEMYRFLVLEVQLGNQYVTNYLAEIMQVFQTRYSDKELAARLLQWSIEIGQMKGTTIDPSVRSAEDSA